MAQTRREVLRLYKQVSNDGGGGGGGGGGFYIKKKKKLKRDPQSEGKII